MPTPTVCLALFEFLFTSGTEKTERSMVHLGLWSIDLLELRGTIRHEGVQMFLGVLGPVAICVAVYVSGWGPAVEATVEF